MSEMVAELPTDSTLHADEDRARADIYALLSRLFASAPDSAFLETLHRHASERANDDHALGQAWRVLAGAVAGTDAAAIEEEYTRLFLSIGRPEVMLYGSAYLTGFLMEEPLVYLRSDLATLGLDRRLGVGESEDHFSALCDVMRHLILSRTDAPGLARQRDFFLQHMAPWIDDFADALESAPDAVFYPRAAPLLRAFFGVERLAFDML
ncbi:MAG TPA: molecular chaperone TorD family protein [Rhodocyclaceae bacterium]